MGQITSQTGSQVKEIYDKIEQLLSGQPVVLERKSVSTSLHPQGHKFTVYKLAEKFVVSPHFAWRSTRRAQTPARRRRTGPRGLDSGLMEGSKPPQTLLSVLFSA